MQLTGSLWQDLAASLLSTAHNLLSSGGWTASQSLTLAIKFAHIKLDQARNLLSHIEKGGEYLQLISPHHGIIHTVTDKFNVHSQNPTKGFICKV